MRFSQLVGATLALVAMAGCSSDVGVQVEPVKGGGASYVSGTPQERIARVQADTTMPESEKQVRIKAIKERNHLQ